MTEASCRVDGGIGRLEARGFPGYGGWQNICAGQARAARDAAYSHVPQRCPRQAGIGNLGIVVLDNKRARIAVLDLRTAETPGALRPRGLAHASAVEGRSGGKGEAPRSGVRPERHEGGKKCISKGR